MQLMLASEVRGVGLCDMKAEEELFGWHNQHCESLEFLAVAFDL
jgi:hypothetical protein